MLEKCSGRRGFFERMCRVESSKIKRSWGFLKARRLGQRTLQIQRLGSQHKSRDGTTILINGHNSPCEVSSPTAGTLIRKRASKEVFRRWVLGYVLRPEDTSDRSTGTCWRPIGPVNLRAHHCIARNRSKTCGPFGMFGPITY